MAWYRRPPVDLTGDPVAIARSVLSVALAGVLVAACTSGNAEPPEPTTDIDAPTTEASPSPTETEDPFAVPAPEDVGPEYVDLVVNTIWERHGELLREILREDPRPGEIMDDEMLAEFEEIFDGQYFVQRTEEADSILQGDREDLRGPSDMDQMRLDTVRVVAADSDCIVAIGEWDNTGTADPGISMLAALALEPTVSISEHNPTGWRLTDLAPNRAPDGQANPDEVMLEATLSDLKAAAIDTPCSEEDER